MTKNGCRCAECRCPVDAGVATAVRLPDVSYQHSRLPGVLRYRGLEDEALAAARLVKFESLIITLRAVLDDLDASMKIRITRDTGDARRVARRRARSAQAMLETALSEIHAGIARIGAHPCGSRPPDDQPKPEHSHA
jgi:hypothetical protein